MDGIDQSFRLLPEQASTVAQPVDWLYYYLWAVTAFFTLLIFVLIVYLGLKYRRKTEAMPAKVGTDMHLELAWTVIPIIVSLSIFIWGAGLYVKMSRPPADAMEVNVVGKQWMWKLQHPAGAREINTLHVPLGRPVKLVMTSQDVIHSFYIPAFRVKQDVLPGRYSYQWFTANKVGEYHLFCAEYCGTQHSGMIGKVVVMDPGKYEQWLAGSMKDQVSTAQAGAQLFEKYGCATCHGQQAPSMAGLYLSQRTFADGRTAIADESYLRESILNSSAKIVAGFPPIMPSFRGQLSEEQVMEMIDYIKSLKVPERGY